jgi:hypothetical protein
VTDRVDPAHRLLASLFFDHVGHEAGRARDHKNAVERCTIHSQVGQNGAYGAVHVDGQGFLCIGERFLNRSRRLDVKR